MNIISDIIKDLINEHYKYISECETKSTELVRQTATIKAKTKILQAHTDLAKKYFQYQMQEREQLFTSASKMLEIAIKTGDTEIAQIALKTIKIIHKKSPFSF